MNPPFRFDPLAGYAGGSFFLRDPHDWFVLFPKGRLQIDSYNYLNRPELGMNVPNSPSDPDQQFKNTVFLRRARIELMGTLIRHFDFHISAEFASVASAGQYGIATDNYIIVRYFEFAQLQVGQFDTPFTLENRTSDKYFDFMERSLTVRAFAVPQNKETGVMLWGWLPRHVAYYSVGLFNGDGLNFKNQDNEPAVIGRAFISPLAPIAHGARWIEELEIGGSFWWQRASNLGGFVTPSTTGATQNDLTPMTTQGGFRFFDSSFANRAELGTVVRSHLAPDGDIRKWAVEAHLPLKRAGLKADLVHQSIALAEYNDAPGAARVGQTGAQLSGTAFYVELYLWLLGDRNTLEAPGLEAMPRRKLGFVASEPRWSLMVAARYEHLAFDVTGLPAGGPLTPGGAPTVDPALGHYTIDSVEVGVNAWGTKHVRMTANYVANYIGGGDSETGAPNEKANLFFQKWEHELLFRLAIAL